MPSVVYSATPNASTASDLLVENKESDCTQCNDQNVLLLQLIDWGLLPKAVLGVLALLCGNGYIVGINQIFDDDIDKVNKPFLPIASGP